ncbi:MAG: metal-dependent hydrolase [Deltaproteobacteria bacterium]|nr:metal-dependent hydrolase [Deltaproteobacteria bacterium]
MAFPIAHATAGYLVYRLDPRRARGTWPRALAFMAIANVPDVDFLVGFLFGRPGAFHRGISHTVLAALVFGALAGTFTWWRRKDRWWPATLLCAAAYGSHLLVDAFTSDLRDAAGAQFFWPLSDAYYISPVTIFNGMFLDGDSRSSFISSIVAWPTVWLLAYEVLVAGVVVVLLRVLDVVQAREPACEPMVAEFGREEELT